MDWKVLSRNNFMIYRGDSSTIIRTYFKEGNVHISHSEHEIFMELISKIQYPVSYNQLLNCDNPEIIKKLLKLMLDFGAIFLCPVFDKLKETDLELCKEQKWFTIYSQYAIPKCNIAADLEMIRKTSIFITEQVNENLPDLMEVFISHGIEARIGNPVEDGKRIILITLNPLDKAQEKCVLEINPFYVYCWLENERNKYYSDMKFENINFNQSIDSRSLISKTAPIYILIYIFKVILGNAMPLMMINSEGKFYEQETLQRDFTMVIPPTMNVLEDKKVSFLEAIETFEKFLSNNTIPLKISGIKDDVFSNLKHIGFSIYGLSDVQGGTLFCNAGIDYESTAYEAIKFGLQSFLEVASKEKWIVSDAKHYYVDKALLLIQNLQEDSRLYHVNKNLLPKDLQPYMDVIPEGTKVYISFQLKSRTFIPIIYDNKNQICFSSLKKQIHINRELKSLVINYLSNFLSKGSVITQPYSKVQLNKFGDFKAAENLIDWNEISISEEEFITRMLALSKENDIRYDEFPWIYEKYLNDTGLIVRMIKTGGYNDRK